MSAGTWASIAGLATLAAVLVLASAARRSIAAPPRQIASPDAQPTVGRSRWIRRRGFPLIVFGIGALTWAAGPVPALAVAASVPVVRVARRRVGETRQRHAVEVAMPSAIELVVVCVHAGLTPARTIEVATGYVDPAVRPGFEAVLLQLHRGRSLGDALGELVALLGRPARELVTAIAGADRDGLPLAPVLDRLASAARAERRRQGEAAARRLPVRLSFPLVACTLPSFVLLTIAPAVLGAVSTLRGSAP